MDKLAIIRSMVTEENNHLQGTHYCVTGHKPNPAMEFPSLGSIIAREMGPRNSVPPYLMPQMGSRYEESFKAHFLGAQYDPMVLPDPSQKEFKIPDLSLPKSVSLDALEDRQTLLKIVDRFYREKVKIL